MCDILELLLWHDIPAVVSVRPKPRQAAGPFHFIRSFLKGFCSGNVLRTIVEMETFSFPSLRLRGNKPLSPDTLLKKIIRPALQRAGIKGKVIGWHSFRHSLATNLRTLGVDVKVAQELLRHANSRTTMDIYTHAVSEQKHEATRKVVDLLVPQKPVRTNPQHPSAPSEVSLLAVSC